MLVEKTVIVELGESGPWVLFSKSFMCIQQLPFSYLEPSLYEPLLVKPFFVFIISQYFCSIFLKFTSIFTFLHFYIFTFLHFYIFPVVHFSSFTLQVIGNSILNTLNMHVDKLQVGCRSQRQIQGTKLNKNDSTPTDVCYIMRVIFHLPYNTG